MREEIKNESYGCVEKDYVIFLTLLSIMRLIFASHFLVSVFLVGKTAANLDLRSRVNVFKRS